MTSFPNLKLRVVDEEVAELAAEMRARYGLSAPDALQVATCLAEGASVFVTNDERLRKVAELEVIVVNDFV